MTVADMHMVPVSIRSTGMLINMASRQLSIYIIIVFHGGGDGRAYRNIM